eukprot:Gb_38728 [translate_table: standard]
MQRAYSTLLVIVIISAFILYFPMDAEARMLLHPPVDSNFPSFTANERRFDTKTAIHRRPAYPNPRTPTAGVNSPQIKPQPPPPVAL